MWTHTKRPQRRGYGLKFLWVLSHPYGRSRMTFEFYFTTMFTSLPGTTMDFTTVLPAMNWALRALAQSPRKCPRKRGRFTRLRGNLSCVHYAGLTTTLTNFPGTAIILTTCMPLVNSLTRSLSSASFSRAALSMSLATDALARTLPFTWNTTSTVFSTALEWSASRRRAGT